MLILPDNQKNLLRWWYSQTDYAVSHVKLMAVISSILEPLEGSNKIDHYDTINGLIALGLVEYQRDRKYTLAPSVILRFKQQMLGFNLPKFDQFELPNIGINRLKNEQVRSYEDIGIEIRKVTPNVCDVIPRLRNVVKNWPIYQGPPLELNSLEHFTSNHGWQHTDDKLQGLYRHKGLSGSLRRLFFEDIWYDLPSINQSPNAIQIAYTLTNPSTRITYDRTRSIMEVKLFMFPPLILRLFMHISGFSFTYDNSHQKIIFRKITCSTFKSIKRHLYGK